MPPRLQRPYHRRPPPEYLTLCFKKTHVGFVLFLLCCLLGCAVHDLFFKPEKSEESATAPPIDVGFETEVYLSDLKPVLNLAMKILNESTNYPEIHRPLDKLIKLLSNRTKYSVTYEWHNMIAWVANAETLNSLKETMEDVVAVEKNPIVTENPILYGSVCLIRNLVDAVLYLSPNYTTDVNETASFVMPPRYD